jgi:hypothetical protein
VLKNVYPDPEFKHCVDLLLDPDTIVLKNLNRLDFERSRFLSRIKLMNSGLNYKKVQLMQH